MPRLKLNLVLAAVGALIAVSAALSAAFSISSLYDSEVKAIQNRLQIPAQAMARTMQQIAGNIDLSLQAARSIVLANERLIENPVAMSALLRQRVQPRAAFQKIEIYDAAGRMIADSSPRSSRPISVADSDFFKRSMTAQQDQLVVSELLRDVANSQAKIVMSRPIIDRRNVTRGVIAAYLDVDYLQRLFNSLQMPAGTTIVLFTRDGRHLLRSPPVALTDKILDVDFSQRASFQVFRKSGPEGAFMRFQTLASGKERFVAGVGGPGSPFVVTANWDTASALEHWRTIAAIIIGFALSGVVIVSALVVYLFIELRRNETLLAQVSFREDKFRALMAALPDAVLIIDQSVTITFANRAAEELLGYERGGLNGLALRETMVPETRSQHEQKALTALGDAKLREGIKGLERVMTRRDGSEFPVEINARPYETPEGRMLIAVIRDVTKREANDRALRVSQENLARAQRVAAVGSFERDLRTEESVWSDEFLRIWGLSHAPTRANVEHLIELVHPQDRAQFIAAREAALDGRSTAQPDFRIIRPDGEIRFLHNEYSVDRDANGSPVRLFGTVQDVTERTRIETEIRRRREALARAQRVASIGSFERNLPSGDVELSDELYRIHGVEPGSPQSQLGALYALVHPDDRKKVEVFRRAAETGTPMPPIDYRIIRPDGAERVLHRECEILFDNHGKPICLFGTLQDITERKNVEIALLHSQERLIRAQRIAGIGSFEHDLIKNEVEWSSELYRIFGLDPGKGGGNMDAALACVHPEDIGKFRSIREQSAKGIVTAAIDFRIIRLDGVERILHRECDVTFDETGKPIRMFGTIQDVTERKQIEIELRRSRKNLAEAQRLAGIGSFERDLVTGQRSLSEEFRRIWGIEDIPAGALRDTLGSMVHPEDRQKFREMREAAFQSRPIPPWDFRITRPDGEERIVHPETRVVFDEGGKPIRMYGTVQDITERKQIEIELRRSREQLARAHRVAGIGSFARDLITGELEWSEEFLRIWGLTVKPTRGSAELLLSLVHPDDRQKFVEGRDAALEQKAQPPLDFRITRPDGQERILHREYGVIFDDSGRPVRMFGTVQDITERMKIELELRRSRESLARAQRIASMGSFDHDLITDHDEWSDELYRLYGLSPQSEGRRIDLVLALVHPEDHDKFQQFRDEVAKGNRSSAGDYRIIRPDGAERILHRECDIVFDQNGRPIRVFGTVQDITERKKAEIELLRSRENLARAQRFAGMGSFERDLITDQAEWSEEMYRIFGIEKLDAAPGNLDVLSLIHPDDRKSFQEYRAAEIKGGSTAPIEYRIVRPDGMERIVRRESAVVFDDEKRAIRLYGTLQDVTERRLAERRERELERQLLHSQKLEALGTLAGGIAHDLNNTLVPIMALSKLTARRFEAETLVRSNLETIYEASVRARDLVKRVVAFSRKDELEKRDTDIGEIVDEALKLLRATIPSSITLEARIEKVPLIPADASQIHQLVTNLVSNASQAIGSEMGTITVTLDLRRSLSDGEEICLSVGDTGAGMDKITQQRIFEPFFTTKPVGQGTGLGLSIVHGIIAGHGGRIEVKSAPGEGTRFDLYFPASAAASMVKSSRPAA